MTTDAKGRGKNFEGDGGSKFNGDINQRSQLIGEIKHGYNYIIINNLGDFPRVYKMIANFEVASRDFSASDTVQQYNYDGAAHPREYSFGFANHNLHISSSFRYLGTAQGMSPINVKFFGLLTKTYQDL